MRYTLLVCVLLVGCSGGNSPTAPTPAPVAVVTPPAVVAPPPVATPNPLLSDPRFSLSFYRDLALGARDGGPFGLQRQNQAPRIYLRTVFEDGRPVDALTLDSTAAALINTAGSLTGVFGLASLEQGTETREGVAGWITVRWLVQNDPTRCGSAVIGGGLIELLPNTTNCGCGAVRIRPLTVKHELGHALGFWHTGDAGDLMSGLSVQGCDKHPSAREVFHAQVAYGQALGSLDPR